METITSIKPLLAVLASALAVIPIICFRRIPDVREGVTFLSGGLKLLLVASMVPLVLDGKSIEFVLVPLTAGLDISFRVDALGMLFALVASSLWIATSAYSIGYMRSLNEHSQTRYYCFFALALSSTIGVAFAANLLTLYIFYEILSLSTYPLVTHHQDGEARLSGRKYLTFILGTSIGFVLPAMLICYSQAGTLDFVSGGFLAGTGFSKTTLTLLLLLFVFGFAKAGVMPFHAWLPAAMVAPTPVSALLHAVAVVKVGVFSILRVVTGVFGVDFLDSLDLGTVLCWIAAFTVIVSSLIALSQDGLKRRLAFSTIGQLSYIVLGAALLTPSAIQGAGLHLVMHAWGKITLFFCAGAIYVAAHKTEISDMRGLGRKMPFTFGAFLIASLSIIGLPPLGGSWSKWYLMLGSLEAERQWIVWVLVISSLLNIAYLLPVAVNAFWVRPDEVPPDPHHDAHDAHDEPATPGFLARFGFEEAPTLCVIPLCLTALGSLILFFYPDPILALVRMIGS